MTNPDREGSCANHLTQASANISGATGKLSALVGSDNLLNEPKNEPKDGNNKPHGTLESVVNEVSRAFKGLHNGIKQKGGVGILSGLSYVAEEPTEVSAEGEGEGTATEATPDQQKKSSGLFGTVSSWLFGASKEAEKCKNDGQSLVE